MPIGFSNRCLVLVTDDGVNVYDVSSGRVKYLQRMAWSQPNFSESLAEVISKDARGKPVLILNDMSEQHYRKERLPSVAFFDRQNVLQRKLNVTFPSYPIRAAQAIKEPKDVIGKEGASGQLYLFCALPASDAISKVIEAIRLSLAPVAGLGVLPVESVSLIKILSQKLRKQKSTALRAGWKILVGQHSSGGLRQIVSKGEDELALTRMTPVSDPDVDPGQWAVEVLQEVKSTVNYLGRFGYKPEDGLEVIFIAQRKNQTVFSDILDINCNLFTLSLTDAANFAGIKLPADADERWADMLHAGWAAKKTLLSLPLPSRDIVSIAQPRQAAAIARNVMLLGCLGVLGFGAYEANGYFTAYDELTKTRDLKIALQSELDAEIKRKESLGIDVKLVQAALSAKKSIKTQAFNPLPLLLRVSKIMPQDLRVDTLTMEYVEGAPDPTAPQPVPGQPVDPLALKNGTFRTVLKFVFPESMKPEIGNKKMLDLQIALQKQLQPDYNVVVSKKVADLSFTGTMQMNIEAGQSKPGLSDASAEIQIDSVLLTPEGDPNAPAPGNN